MWRKARVAGSAAWGESGLTYALQLLFAFLAFHFTLAIFGADQELTQHAGVLLPSQSFLRVELVRALPFALC